jgi:hypothetical protein
MLRSIGAVLVAAMVLVPAGLAKEDAGGAAKKKFSPKLLKGDWSGTWQNLTFGTSGAIDGSFGNPGKNRKLKMTLDFDGSVFGCQDPPEGTITIPKGRGVNKWNGRGFKVEGPSLALGQRTLSFAYRTREVTGKGKDPPCAPGLTWTLTGKMSKKLKRLTATVDITLSNGQKAVSKLDVRKQ